MRKFVTSRGVAYEINYFGKSIQTHDIPHFPMATGTSENMAQSEKLSIVNYERASDNSVLCHTINNEK